MVNVPWCHDCDRPEGLCECSPEQDLQDYHAGVVAGLMAEITRVKAEAASALLALEGERDALREALKPFATCIDRLAPGEDISHWALGDALNHGLTVEHVLRAQAALSKSEHT
jgi:hypothetical protein